MQSAILQQSPGGRSEIRTLTALRGAVACWVLLFHYNLQLARPFSEVLLRNGHLAVDVFFVLSGFIMYYVYNAEVAAGRFSYRGFMIKRLARIYPVHFVTTMLSVAMFVVGGRLGLADGMRANLGDAWAHLLMIHAWGVTHALRLNFPSWSISAEFFAYLCFPLLIGFVRLFSPRIVMPAAAAMFLVYCAIYVRLFAEVPKMEDLFGLTFRFAILRILPEFVLGLAVARAAVRTGRATGPLLALVLAGMVAALYGGLQTLFVLLIPALILLLANWRAAVPGWLHYLGLISFSLYMVHGLIENVAFRLAEALFGWHDGAPRWSLPVFVALAILAAAACYHLVEEPGRRLVVRWLAPRRRVPNAGPAL